MNDIPITEAVAMWTERLRPLILERKATFFEASTAIAFADFAARGAEIAVVEVSLGGRLDSTNVVRPLASAVTKIERDHMKYLGNTLEKIACEKAGIAKPGAPFIIGEREPALVEVLRREAHRAVARQDPDARADVRGPAAGVRMVRAVESRGPAPAADSVAHGVLVALPTPYRPDVEAINHAFGHARIPGRMDRRGKWLFDVAHNPDGIRALIAALDATHQPRPIHGLVSVLGIEVARNAGAARSGAGSGVLTVAPTARAAAGTPIGCGAGFKRPAGRRRAHPGR